MNSRKSGWPLTTAGCWLLAESPTGELHTLDYTAAREHADAVLNSLIKAGEVRNDT